MQYLDKNGLAHYNTELIKKINNDYVSKENFNETIGNINAILATLAEVDE